MWAAYSPDLALICKTTAADRIHVSMPMLTYQRDGKSELTKPYFFAFFVLPACAHGLLETVPVKRMHVDHLTHACS